MYRPTPLYFKGPAFGGRVPQTLHEPSTNPPRTFLSFIHVGPAGSVSEKSFVDTVMLSGNKSDSHLVKIRTRSTRCDLV